MNSAARNGYHDALIASPTTQRDDLERRQDILPSRPTLLGVLDTLCPIKDPGCGQISAGARQLFLPAQQILFREGDPCQDFLLLVEGAMRVQRITENGHVITLNHIHSGETCKLATACLLGGKHHTAETVTETQIQAITIPKRRFLDAMAKSPLFRDYVFTSLDSGIQELIQLVEQIAFVSMDVRLSRCLLSKSRGLDVMEITHHQLAEELGTAREVISRLLKEFERRGWLELQRGRIRIIDRNVLQTVARPNTM